jgi:rhodanese-related sulfurtransferase
MPKTAVKSRVLEFAPAKPAAAKKHFLAKLACETDAWDVNADMENGAADGFVVLDARRPEAYAKEHIKGAVNLHHGAITRQAAAAFKGKVIVTYCTGVGCNASTKAAAKLSALGFKVKELVGGLEWWKNSGHPTEGSEA